MSVGNDVVPESGSALSRSAGGSKNGKAKSLWKLSNTTRYCSYTSPPLKKGKRLTTTTSQLPSVSQTFLFSPCGAAGGERRGIVESKTATRKEGARATTMPIEHECNVDNNLEELQLKNVEARWFPSECVGRLVPEGTWQHKTSEKVTQWLEDSCQSSVTGIVFPVASTAGCVKLDPRNMTTDYETGQEDVASHSMQGQGLHSSPERGGDSSSYVADQRLPGTTLVSAAHVKVCSDGGAMATVCGIRYSIRCLKMIACLPIVLLGLYLKIKPNPWGQFEPPPT